VRALPADPAWQFVVEGGSDMRLRVEESWLTTADGSVGTRGSVEEDGVESDPLTLAAGVYNEGQSLLEVPSWATLSDAPILPVGRRVLDLRDGVLWREAIGEDSAARIDSARFACLARPGVGVLVAEVTGRRVAASMVPPTIDAAKPAPAEASTEVTEVSPRRGGNVLRAMRTTKRPAPDASVNIVVRVAVHDAASRRRPARAEIDARLEEAWHTGPAGLLVEQRRAWGQRWERADVEVVGDPELTRVIRFGLFHLMASVPGRGAAAVGARGLTGRAYSGHVFWDADVFVLPFLAATDPPAARAMLEYRIRRLAAARRAAAAEGHTGARFPWESATDGSDVTPRAGLDEHGNEVPILTGRLEEHISADVAWAAWRFAAWGGRWAFLDGAGGDLVVDPARYWSSRVRLDEKGAAHIDGVIGPDEYHEDVDDNAFTNVMASWNLYRAAELCRRQRGPDAAGEADRLEQVADHLVTGYDPTTGLYEQFAGYKHLEPLLVAPLGTVPFAADVLLGRGRVARSQLIKQADALMLHHMVPDITAAASLAPNLDFYLPRTCHGSSLSPSIHAGLLARVGRVEEARSLLELAAHIDVDDLTGTTAGGLHVANFGGIWQALIHGFAGVVVSRPDDEVLRVEPRLPGEWKELRIRLSWHGRNLELRCQPSALHVSTDRPLVVEVAGTRVQVDPPGRWVS